MGSEASVVSTRCARALSRAVAVSAVVVRVCGLVRLLCWAAGVWVLVRSVAGGVMLTVEAALWIAAAGGGAVWARLRSAPEYAVSVQTAASAVSSSARLARRDRVLGEVAFRVFICGAVEVLGGERYERRVLWASLGEVVCLRLPVEWLAGPARSS